MPGGAGVGERVDHLLHGCQAGEPYPVATLTASSVDIDQTVLDEHLQVPADRRPADLVLSGQVTRSNRLGGDPSQQVASHWVGQGREYVHDINVTFELRFDKVDPVPPSAEGRGPGAGAGGLGPHIGSTVMVFPGLKCGHVGRDLGSMTLPCSAVT